METKKTVKPIIVTDKRKVEKEKYPLVSNENVLHGTEDKLKSEFITEDCVSTKFGNETFHINKKNEFIADDKVIDNFKKIGFKEIEVSEDLILTEEEKKDPVLAKKKIRQYLTSLANCGQQVDPPSMGWGTHLAVLVYTNRQSIINSATGKKTILIIPDTVAADQKFINCVGLVVSKGKAAYTGWRFVEHWFIRFLRIFFNAWMTPVTKQPLCKVGDWIVFPRNQGTQISWRGLPMQFFYDEFVYTPVENPTYVTRD